MMFGGVGAVLCTLAGTALGGVLRERKYARLRLLESENDALTRLRLMLMEEKLGMKQLLRECAAGEVDGLFSKRLVYVAGRLDQEPLLSLETAYEESCRFYPLAAEQKPERQLMSAFFRQLGTGSAAMREAAAASALRRLKPLLEEAAQAARTGGKLCLQLGLLGGLIVGIALW